MKIEEEEMFVSRAIRGLKVSTKADAEGKYDINDMIDMFGELKAEGDLDKYKANVERCVTESIYDDAAKFAGLHYDKYVCTDIKKLEFYTYTHNIWRLDHACSGLLADVIRFAPKTGMNHRYRHELIKDIAHHLYARKFTSRLGSFKAIDLCGVSFDFTSGTLRPGTPNDYTSLSTGYIPSVDYQHEVEKMIEDILPQTDVRKYLMRFLGSLLIPGNNDKIFMVWSGKGNNGKSVLARLIELALGEYSVKLPTSLVTGNRVSSGSATPELVLMDKRLVAFLQEPGDAEKLNIGMVKELTGNDSLYVRGLYEEAKNISILAKLIYIVNSTDNMARVEKATWSRIVVIPFDTHFTDEPRLANERAKDIHLMGRLRKYAPALLKLMLDEAQQYIKHGLLRSDTIERATEEVKNSNDHIKTFFDSNDMDHSYQSLIDYMKLFAPRENPPSYKDYESYRPIR
jgi:hypothetical protein